MTAYAAGAPVGLGALLAAVRAGTSTPTQAAPRPRTPVDDPPANTLVPPRPRPRPRPYPTPPPAAEPPPEPTEPATDDVWPIVAAAQAGDAAAFAQLYDRYVDLVFRYIYFRIGDRPTAEDFTSETFLRALRRIGSLANIGRDPGAWFVTIARNIVLDHVKSSRYRLEITTDEMSDIERSSDESAGPENAAVNRLTNETLLASVKELGSEQQECIVLRFLHGLSVAETAAAMGKNEGAIKALQHRAVRRLATLVPQGLR
jgi:RNA polymerase sigma-70 factor (ECF subfamily)